MDEITAALEDKYLRCRDCGIWFVFTRAEQQRFQERGYEHEPTRCPTCRYLRRHSPPSHRRRGHSDDTA